MVTLGLIAIASALAISSRAQDGTLLPSDNVPIPDVARFALDQLNRIRNSRGVPSLCLNLKLQGSAQEQSNWMASRGVMAHAPDTFPRMERHGYPKNTARAENVAVNQLGVRDNNCFANLNGRVDDVVTSAAYTTNCAWFKSAGHFRNMVDPTFTQVGIAFTAAKWDGQNAFYWTQNFGKSDDPCVTYNGNQQQPPLNPQPQQPSPSPSPQQPPFNPQVQLPSPTPQLQQPPPTPQPQQPPPSPTPQQPPFNPRVQQPTPTPQPQQQRPRPQQPPIDSISDYVVAPTTPRPEYTSNLPISGQPYRKCKKWIPGGKKNNALNNPNSRGYSTKEYAPPSNGNVNSVDTSGYTPKTQSYNNSPLQSGPPQTNKSGTNASVYGRRNTVKNVAY